MKSIEKCKKAKRDLEKILSASYLGRLLFLELLLAFLLVNEFPGFDVQNWLPMGVFVLLLGLVYFIFINVARMIVSRFLAFILPKAGIEVLFILANAYFLEDIISKAEGVGLSNNNWRYGLVFLSIFSLWFFSLFLWRFLQQKRNRFTLAGLGMSSVLLLILCFYSFSHGFDFAENQEIKTKFNNKRYQGEYEVDLVEYGPDEKLDLGLADFSDRASVSSWQRKIRKKMLGYGLSDIPFTGRVFLPKGKKEVPFIIFVHGNHNMLEDNMGGYNYLGNFLASQGYGFVSIDQSVFNGYMGKGTGNENDARALFLLEHTKKLLEESKKKSSPLYKRLNSEEIILGGHSRGGEAAATAAYFNSLVYLPDDGSKVGEDSISIKGVLAVAPTYGQYMPSDHPVKLENISYLLIHGSHDQDVNSLQGLDQYRYIDFTEEKNHFKAQVLVAKANHGQFNENWGRRDKSLPMGFFLNTKDLLKVEDQEKILQVYCLNFLKIIEGQEDSKIFMDIENLRDVLPKTRYFTRYENDSRIKLADFEEDSRLETGSHNKVKISGEELGMWTEEAFCTSENEESQEHVFYGNPTAKDGLIINLPPSLSENGDGIKVDVAFKKLPSDIDIAITDTRGNRARLSSKNKKEIFGPEKTGLTKWQHLAKKWEDKNALQSLYFPYEDFLEKNPQINIERIEKIELFTSPTTYVYFDDISIISFNKND